VATNRGAWGVGAGAREAGLRTAEASGDAAAARTPRVAYFGPDLDDPAVRRRVAQWRHAGYEVLAAAFARRGRAEDRFAINLGRISARSRLRRIIPLMFAAARLFRMRKRLAGVDLFIARNVDNAILALFARRITRTKAPLVYEVLDINSSCTAAGLQAWLLRKLERLVLARICLLVVSSPYFIWDYYQKHLTVSTNWLLFENKVPRHARLPRGRQPLQAELPAEGERPWRIGWFGYLDDARSWHILRRLATELPHRVTLSIRGMPYDNFDMKNFLHDIENLENAVYGGPFRNPEDLAEIYGAVDIVWSADCNELSANSKWLLTNGIYEAGFFGKPVIGLARTAIGEFLERHQSGWSLDDPADEALISLIARLTPEAYREKQMAIFAQGQDRFIETDEVNAIWHMVQSKEMRQLRPLAAAEGADGSTDEALGT
jgi:succinoglycan biosynthesis protein ExoL